MSSLPAVLPRLRAVTRAFDGPRNLLDARAPDGFAWLRDGSGFVTAGVAARLPIDDAIAALAAAEVDDPLGWPGTGLLAVGGLPFDRAAPAELVIPSTVVGRRPDGRAWVSEVGDAASFSRVPDHDEEPSCWRVTADSSRARWRAMVSDALQAIGRGQLAKVVLARAVTVEADAPFVVSSVLHRLHDRQRGCFVYHADGLVGASPELLVRRLGRRVESCPLAGTAPAGDGATETLRGSGKDAREHRLVVEDVVGALAPECVELDVPTGPAPTAFASVVHLATPLRGVLRDPGLSSLTLARRLHPTAAVAGTPRDEALRMLAALEPTGRGRYAGPVGWVDHRGDGEWAIALRGAALDGRRAVLHAGAGIVAGSDPDAEWVETQAKLEPMLEALIRP